jgi:hypothetical protein
LAVPKFRKLPSARTSYIYERKNTFEIILKKEEEEEEKEEKKKQDKTQPAESF